MRQEEDNDIKYQLINSRGAGGADVFKHQPGRRRNLLSGCDLQLLSAAALKQRWLLWLSVASTIAATKSVDNIPDACRSFSTVLVWLSLTFKFSEGFNHSVTHVSWTLQQTGAPIREKIDDPPPDHSESNLERNSSVQHSAEHQSSK